MFCRLFKSDTLRLLREVVKFWIWVINLVNNSDMVVLLKLFSTCEIKSQIFGGIKINSPCTMKLNILIIKKKEMMQLARCRRIIWFIGTYSMKMYIDVFAVIFHKKYQGRIYVLENIYKIAVPFADFRHGHLLRIFTVAESLKH